MISRRSFLVMGLGAALAAPGGSPGASRRLVVEDWSGAARGARGVPPGWEPYETPGGRPAYDFAVVEDEGRWALRVRSADDHSTIAKRVQVELDTMPILEWSWKLTKLPAGADVRRRATSDLAVDVLVIWPRFPAPLRSRLIGYAWDAAAPAGSVVPSPKTSTVSFVIVRSGAADSGRWMSERRNVAEDY